MIDKPTKTELIESFKLLYAFDITCPDAVKLQETYDGFFDIFSEYELDVDKYKVLYRHMKDSIDETCKKENVTKTIDELKELVQKYLEENLIEV